MKIWSAFGSEHSMNLVMIGEFKEIEKATDAMKAIEAITGQVDKDLETGQIEVSEHREKYSKEMLDLLSSLNVFTIGVDELQQFAYDIKVKRDGNQIVVTTDECDVSAFLKVMLDKGARVEVFSAHDYPDTEYGRGL